MKKLTIGRRGVIAQILFSTSLIAGPAFAQAEASQIGAETPAAPAAALPAQDDALEDIVVTAQRRDQNLQDVPIAITALDEKALEANRVVNVNDLSGLAPGVTVRPAAGGTQTPSFTIRGAVSYGIVPGSGKQASIYLDGVYIASPRVSIFDLPTIVNGRAALTASTSAAPISSWRCGVAMCSTTSRRPSRSSPIACWRRRITSPPAPMGSLSASVSDPRPDTGIRP